MSTRSSAGGTAAQLRLNLKTSDLSENVPFGLKRRQLDVSLLTWTNRSSPASLRNADKGHYDKRTLRIASGESLRRFSP
jgi:hypothetical protein